MLDRKFLELIVGYRFHIFVVSIFMFLASMVDSISLASLPVALRIVFNSDQPPVFFRDNPQLAFIDELIRKIFFDVSPMEAMYRLALFVVLVFLFKFIFLYTKELIVAFTEERIMMDIRNRMFRSLLQFPIHTVESMKVGEIVSRFTNDVKLLRGAITEGFFEFIHSLIKAVVFISLAILLVKSLFFFAVFIIVPLGILLALITKYLRRRWEKLNIYIAKLGAYIGSVVRGMRVLKVFSNVETEYERFLPISRKYFSNAVKLEALNRFAQLFSEFVVSIPIAILLVYSAHLILVQREITSDQFIVFLLIVVSSISPIKRLFRANNFIQQGVSAYRRCLQFIDIPKEDKGGNLKFETLRSELLLRDVGFGYGSKPILENINLRISKGEKLAIVGPSGSGKTTLLNIISGLIKPDRGEILLDGISLWEYDIHSYRRRIAIVPQETFLFEGSIYDNLTLGEDIPIERVVQVCKLVGAHEFIEKLPNGYFHVLSEGGANLSGGQKQRLSIARAILRNPEILIMDEPTSNLDAVSERRIVDAVVKFLPRTTVIVVSHRITSIRDMDRIVVLENGKLVCEGKHEELVRRCSLYRRSL